MFRFPWSLVVVSSVVLAFFAYFLANQLQPPTYVGAAEPIDDTPVTKRVMVLNFDPILENQSGLSLTQFKQWQDPQVLTQRVVDAFPSMSHGYLSYEITQFQTIDGFPVKSDGFVYTDDQYLNCLNTNACHQPDLINYQQIISTYNICAQNVDEVWLWGGPYFGYYEFNPIQACGKTMFVMGFNYERAYGEALHDFGHRMEYVGIRRVGDGTWSQNEANEWNKFSLIAGHCGNIHYPPHSPTEYGYNHPTQVSSDCNGYLNYPTGPFTPQTISCQAWGCTQEGFVHWWLSRIPAQPGMSVIGNKSLYHNWWKYYAFFDETFTPPPPVQTGEFSNLSATFPVSGPATFNFSYSGSASSYTIDLSTYPDMSWDVYLNFGSGSQSPVVVSNPTKWDKYSCDRTLYWRVKTGSVTSAIQTTTVNCTPVPTSSPTPLPPTPTPTPAINLLLNPSFESGTTGHVPPNWSGPAAKLTRSTTTSHSGIASARLFGTNASFTVTQRVAITPQTPYLFTGWVKIPEATHSIAFKMYVQWSTPKDINVSLTPLAEFTHPTTEWVQVSQLLMAPTSASQFKLILEATGLSDPIYVDNFSLTHY